MTKSIISLNSANSDHDCLVQDIDDPLLANNDTIKSKPKRTKNSGRNISSISSKSHDLSSNSDSEKG
jgi:hypothetical protein